MVFRADGRLEYEVRVDVPSQPLRDAQFTFEVPASFLAGLPANAEIRAFYLNAWSDAEEHLETFEMLPERFTGAPGTVTVTLPPYAFSSALGTDGAFHAVVLLAATPTARGSAGPASSALATRADPCQGTTIGPPLNGALEVTSPYGQNAPRHGRTAELPSRHRPAGRVGHTGHRRRRRHRRKRNQQHDRRRHRRPTPRRRLGEPVHAS